MPYFELSKRGILIARILLVIYILGCLVIMATICAPFLAVIWFYFYPEDLFDRDVDWNNQAVETAVDTTGVESNITHQ
jgi:hypothetical protein